MVANDLDRVLVRADRAVGSKPPEFAGNGAFRRGFRMLRNRQGVVGYVILDSDSEAGLGLRCFEIVIDGDHTAGRGILGTETITAADNLDIASARGSERGCDVKVKGFAKRAGLFCTVEHSNAFNGLRQRRKEAVGCERTIQADFDKA